MGSRERTSWTVILDTQPAQTDGLGGAGKLPNSSSAASSKESMVPSYPGGPTNCRLVGVPEEVCPMGKLPAATHVG